MGLDDLFSIGVELIHRAFVIVKDFLTRFFKAALDFMNVVLNKLENKVVGELIKASHCIRRIGGIYQEATINYSIDRELGEWHQTTVKKDIPLENIPPKYDVLNRNGDFIINDTRELEANLSYSY